MTPKKNVTIVIPTIGRDMLYSAVLSAQNQIGGVVKEIIICQDFKYRDKILNLPPQNNKIPYRVVLGNIGGVADNLNTAISMSTTELISWLSDDDMYTEIKVLRQINILNASVKDQKNLDNIFMISNFSVMDFESGQKEDHDISWVLEKNNQSQAYFALSRGLISGCTVLFSKSLWEKAGGFPEEFKTTQDYVLWSRIIAKEPVFMFDTYSGMITTHHDKMESKVLSTLHNIEKKTLINFTFASYVAAKQTNNLSIATQRELYFFPPSANGLYHPFYLNEDEDISRCCRHELILMKYCLMIIETDSLEQEDVAMLTHQVASVLRESISGVARLTGVNVKDADLGWFVDGYYVVRDDIKVICGLPAGKKWIDGKSNEKILKSAITHYRYVIAVKSEIFKNKMAYSEFLEDLLRFDTADSVQNSLVTPASNLLMGDEDLYKIFAKNPFLADEASLNVTA